MNEIRQGSTEHPPISPHRGKKRVYMKEMRQSLTAYGFLLPWLIGLLVLTLGSFLFSIYLAFTKYDLISSPSWVGLKNFSDIFSDELFFSSLKVTLLYVVVSVPLRLIFSLLVATLLNQDIAGIGIYRVMFYIPSLIGTSVGVAIMWQNIFSGNGLLNMILKSIGFSDPPSWVSDPNYAIYVLVLLSIWQFGSEMIIFLAGLKQIPDTLYEAAAIDGANKYNQFFRVTLPMLTPMIFFNLVMGTINAFMVFTQGFVITHGGPINSTLFYVLYLYKQGFEYFHMGYAAAMSIVLLIIIAVMAGFIFLTSKFWVHYEGEDGGKN